MSRKGATTGAAPATHAVLEEAMALHRDGRLAEAERRYAEVLRQQPGHARAMHRLGAIALQTGRAEKGVALIAKAVDLDPTVAGAHSDLGLGLQALRRHEEALASFNRAIALRPGFARAHYNRGNVLWELKRPADALVSYDRAIALDPNYARAHNNRGNVLLELQRPEDALRDLERAATLAPDYAHAHYNRANALREVKRHEEALASYDRAIALKPDHFEAQCNRAYCLLAMGCLEEGWRAYEWRKKRRNHTAARAYSRPLWFGEADLADRTLFLYWEQGLGDTIQFCRYAQLATARGARVVLSVQDPLRRLLGGLGPGIEVVGAREEPAAFDFHAPLMSLPLAFGTTAETIPAEVPYLAAEPERVRAWHDKLDGGGFKIGIFWQGKKGKVDIGRSFPVAELQRLTALPGVRLISLQKNEGSEQLDDLPREMHVQTLGAEFDSGPDAFLDTAAVMAHLDLIITSDTAVAHLAGALGRRAWVALKHVPDWRWLLEGERTPWYPTLRLFRQASRGNWASVFGAMREALAAERGAPAPAGRSGP